MSHLVRVTPAARKDLRRLADFLVEVSPRAARRARDTIDAALRTLSEHPARAPLIEGDLRVLMIPFGQSGYVAHFRIVGRAVVIARLFHMREDRPG